MRSASATRALRPRAISIVTWCAAECKAVRMDEVLAAEHGDRGRARAHVDHRGAEVGFVVGKHGEPRHIGACHHRLDIEVAALDAQHQVARDRDVGGDDVHVDAELARQHPARIADAVGVVDHVADRQRVQHRAGFADRVTAAGRQDTGDFTIGDRRVRDFDRRRNQLAGGPSGRDRDDDRLQLQLRRAFGKIDGLPHRRLRGSEIDHGAGLHATGERMSESR